MDMEKINPVLKGIPWIRYKKGETFFFDYVTLGMTHPVYDFHEAMRFIEKSAKENGVKVSLERLHAGVRGIIVSRRFPYLPYTDEEADELGLPRHVPKEYGLTSKLRKMAIGDVLEIHPHKRYSAHQLADRAGIKISCEKIDGARMKVTRTA